jgi:peroxidase
MAIKHFVVMLLPMALLLLATGSSPVVAQLELGYYSKTCPNAEAIVRAEMEKIISAAPSLAGPLLRLHFHDCFVRVSSLHLAIQQWRTNVVSYRIRQFNLS